MSRLQDSVIHTACWALYPTGLSDPYCMLGIVSSGGSGADVDDAAAGNGNGGKKKATGTAVDMIPARFIKTTSVKENTLTPVWNEKFRLYVYRTTSLCFCVDFYLVDCKEPINGSEYVTMCR